MTGLDQSLSEQLQVANYGLGGHYEPHYDMAMDDERTPLNINSHGNRIATVLFYVRCLCACGATYADVRRRSGWRDSIHRFERVRCTV
jgi:prolyl 4-hydroxylase